MSESRRIELWLSLASLPRPALWRLLLEYESSQQSHPHFHALADHPLKYETDDDPGGLYNRGLDNLPATDTDKIWWVQAELIGPLTTALHTKTANAIVPR